MVILLFGSSGLIGANILDHLVLTSSLIYIYSRSKDLLFICDGIPRIISRNISLVEAFHLASPDIIINSVGSTKTPTQIIDSNILFVSNLMFALSSYSSATSKPIHFFQISSLSASNPYSFLYPHKLNLYELSKLSSDLVILSIAKLCPNLRVTFVRPSIVFSTANNIFLKKLFLLFLFSPLRLDSHDFTIPLVPVEVVSRYIVESIPFSCSATSNLIAPLTSCHTLSDIHSLFLRYSTLYRFFNHFKISSPYLLHLIALSPLQRFLPAKLLSIPTSAFRRSILRLYFFPTILLLR